MTFRAKYLAMVLALALAISLKCLIASHGAGASSPKAPPIRSTQIGPFTVDTYANVSYYLDNLRFKKAYYKLVTSSKLFGPQPIATHKISSVGEWIRCDNLTLARPEVEHMIDCKPLEWHLHAARYKQEPSWSFDADLRYAVRLSARFKSRQMWKKDDTIRRGEASLYLMRDDIADAAIRTTRVMLDLEPDEAASESYESFGFYMDFSVPTSIGPVRCLSNLYLSLNLSGMTLVDFPADANLAEQFSTLYRAARQGFVFHLENMSCSLSDDTGMLPLSIEQGLMIACQQQFPYLSLKHYIKTQPMGQLFHYTGNISQTRAAASDGGDKDTAYNMDIHMASHSAFFEKLNFNLDQVFVLNEDAQSGSESMLLMHPDFAALVQGEWSPGSFVKSLKLELMPDQSKGPQVEMSYTDQEGDEFSQFSFKLKRNFLESLFGNGKRASSTRAKREEL